MLKKDYEKYINNFYNINPDNLEDEYVKVVKAFYIFSNLTSQAYVDQLLAKDEIKKLSAQVFIKAKEKGDTDKKAEAVVNASDLVDSKRKDYLSKLNLWEEYKGHKETTVMKHDVLKSIGFNRKNEMDIETS